MECAYCEEEVARKNACFNEILEGYVCEACNLASDTRRPVMADKPFDKINKEDIKNDF